MSNSGIQSPLGINTLGSLLANQGFNINPVSAELIGESQDLATYTPGTIVNNTCLNYLVQAINAAYGIGISSTTYNNLISIGSTTIPALGNSKPPTYTYTESNIGPLGDQPGWGGTNYASGNEATRYGYIRLFALQAYDEFNYNDSLPAYKDFLNSFQTSQSYMNGQNSTVQTLTNSKTFLTGFYSNINDLITGDISGVNLATLDFGKDLENLGKAIDLSRIASFGLPSSLLITLKNNNAITKSLSLALLSSGFTPTALKDIFSGVVGLTKDQEKKLYQAFSIILGQDLFDILIPLNCKTQGLTSLVDLLNPIKLFPLSYKSLTVPVYNVTTTTTNSKTYYLIYNNEGVNSQLNQPAIANQIGTIIPPGPPPIISQETNSNSVIVAFLNLSDANKSQVIKQYNEYIYGPKYNQMLSSVTVNSDLTITGGSSQLPFDVYLKTIWYKTQVT